MNYKRIVFIVIILFVLIGVISVGFYYYQKQGKPVELADDQDLTEELAQTELNKELCLKMDDARGRDLCLKNIGVKVGDNKACGLISDSKLKDECLVSISYELAKTSNNLAGCEAIGDQMLEKNCVEKIITQAPGEDCQELKDSELLNICKTQKNYQLAKKDNDAAACNKIPSGIIRANCLSEITGADLHADADNDGLDFLAEHMNGTDVNNRDTDGDGFVDGEEVKNGYNPVGLGKLGEQDFKNTIRCDEIEDPYLSNFCSGELVDGYMNLFNCQDLENIELINYCEQEFYNLNKKQ